MRGAALGLLLLTLPAQVEAQAAELRFITCPVYRDADAGKKSGCWLADNHEDGRRYDVSPSPIKPDWNYAVLVGAASRRPRPTSAAGWCWTRCGSRS